MAGSLADRLLFFGIDDETRSTLRENKSFINSLLEDVLVATYRGMLSFPAISAFFRDEAHIGRAKQAQLRHWQTILDGAFDAAYEASIKRIGETHHRIGLDTVWYVGGYNILLNHLLRAVDLGFPAAPSRPGRGRDA